ncbi:MAG: DUF58 domain-containing protein [Polyangiaceae bacterium]
MRTFYRLLRAGFHTALLFVLPWLTGALAGMIFDVRQVKDTAGQFATLFSFVVVPLLVLQLAAISVKVGREMRASHAAGKRGFAVFVDALDRHVRVLTGRGLGMAVASLLMVVTALAVKWAELGVLAVAGLGLMYVASTVATLVSAFSVRAFDDRVRRRRGSIDREMSPAVVDAGDPVEERFVLARMPVPSGFRLHIEEALPARLGGDTRFAVDRTVSHAEVAVSAPLAKTPRGVYKVGPAEIWYEDILGLTRVFVAARAEAALRALPRVRAVVFERRPRSRDRAEGSFSIVGRLPTEEHYRTRAYVAGDDTRRVHWKQSINTGQLIVRVPESVPMTPNRVRIVLDTFVPERGPLATAGAPADGLSDVLDLLVDAWVSVANELLSRGERVSIAAAITEDGVTTVREVDCRRGESRRWRSLAAEFAWQSALRFGDVAARLPDLRARGPVAGGALPSTSPRPGSEPSTVVVTAGFGFGGAVAPGTSFVVGDATTVAPDAPPVRRGLARLLMFPYPAGAEDNRMDFGALLRPKPTPYATFIASLSAATQGMVGFASQVGASTLLARRRGASIVLEPPQGGAR